MNAILKLASDPRAFNVVILILFAITAIRWAFAKQWGQCVYWSSAFVLNFAVTFMRMGS